jgi:hypothetical protein
MHDVAAILLAAVAAQTAAPPDSVARLVDVPALALLEPDVVCRQFASTDPAGRGDDHGHFLKLEGRRALLAEMDGPGVIVRLWSANPAGRLIVTLDGAEKPQIDAPFQDLFTGKVPPFCEPIATHQGGGWISYFPIAYRTHCKVEVGELEDPRALYYQVQYLTYPRRTRLRTFTHELPRDEVWALRKVVELWNSPPSEPPPSDARAVLDLDEVRSRYFFELGTGSRQNQSGGIRVEPGATVPTLEARSGPGVVRYLAIDLADPRPSALRGLVLEVTVDGAPGPQVSAPVADLFSNGFGPRAWKGLLAGGTDRGGWLRLPICWKREAVIAWRNTTAEPIVANVVTSVLGRQGLSDELAYLHAEFRSTDQVGEPLYEFANVPGAGKFVGLNLALQGVGDLWYLEGNEQISVDGEASPSIVGTGTEDFFNGGWYWDSGPLALALHGLGVKEEWTSNRTTPWRHLLPDAVPFRDGFVGRIEHGSANAVRDASYSSVAFWYSDAPVLVRRVPAEEARVPRRWVRRPPGAIPAVSMQWSPAEAMTKTSWEQLSSELRGCEYPLHQGFPVSHFERDRPKMPSELALLRGREVRAAFTVDEGDRYRLRLHLARHRGSPKLDVRIDDRSIGTIVTDGSDLPPAPAGSTRAAAAPAPPESIQPFTSPELGPVGLARGAHRLTLRALVPEEEAGARDGWIGLDALSLESAAPYVRSWWVAPPVECDPAATVEQEPAAQRAFLGAQLDPAASGWREVADAGDVANLNELVSPRAPVLGYLMTFVLSPDDRVARARLGSDDGVQLWCNGALVWTNALHRPITPDADRFDVPLVKGWNVLLVKVRNDDGGYALSLRLADPDGALRIATKRE